VAPTLSGNEIFTSNGSRTHLTLPDGTIVWLNAGSRITYEKNFDANLRAVTLTGEAFFDVAPNASKPFVIHTAHIDIRVLGTSFNVKSYPSDKTTEATLIRGSIEVSIRNRTSDRIVLKPNEKLIVNNEDSALLAKESAVHRRKIDESLVVISKPTYEHNSGAIIETSWIDNKLIFQDEAFSDLARKMERWYGITIRFDGTGKEDLRFTGTFEKETIQQALDALKLTGNFNYSIDGTQITIHD
jgi:ferric-dicitrate binding protein FerR (iron transport regulator)